MGNMPTLLLDRGNSIELKGTIKEQAYLPPNSKCETCFFKLNEALGYMFQVNIPKNDVKIMNLLGNATNTESVFKGKVIGPIANKGNSSYIVALSYASISGYEMSFTRRTAKILNE